MIEPVRKAMPMGDGALSYLEWQNDAPPLHFANANGFNAQTYTSLLQPLSDRFHIYASDLRGHGFSTLPTPPGFAKGWRQYRDDLIGLLEKLGGGPTLLAGHSMGGTTSLMVAAARPDLVRGLVLVEPVFVHALTRWLRLLPPFFAQEVRRGDPAKRAIRRRDVFESAQAMEAAYRGRGAFATWPDTVLHDYVAGGSLPTGDGRVRLACTPYAEAAAYASALHGAYRLASRVRCPVTVLHGDQEGSTCRPQEAQKFVRRKPDTRVVAVPGASHFLPMEFPQIVRDEINRMSASL